jgi:hypothetical protein
MDPENERIEVGVAIVSASPARLACANRLAQLLEREPELEEMLGEVPIAVIDEGPGARCPRSCELRGRAGKGGRCWWSVLRRGSA